MSTRPKLDLPRFGARADRALGRALSGAAGGRPGDVGHGLFAGLRLGELLALRWSDVDLATGIISVERSFDSRAGFVEPKSQAGCRRVPIAAQLGEYLIRHRELTGRDDEDLAFGRTADRPFAPSAINDRVDRYWAAAGLRPIRLHECRHTCASYFIAAGVNAKTLSTFLGHSSVSITLDRYGHLLPGAEAEARVQTDAFLEATQQTGKKNEPDDFAHALPRSVT